MIFVFRVIFRIPTLQNGLMLNLESLSSSLGRANVSGSMYNVKSGGW